MSELNEFNFSKPGEPALSADDRRLLDALVDAQFDRRALGRLSDAEQRRLDVLIAMMGAHEGLPG